MPGKKQLTQNNTPPLREYSLKGGSFLSFFQYILVGEVQLSTKNEESNHDDYADET